MLKYDKLKNVDNDEIYFDFKCPICNCNGMEKNTFEIKPVGVSWKPDMIDNSDIKNDYIRKKLDKLPTLRQAIEKVVKEDNPSQITIACNICNIGITTDKKINPSDMRKWLNKNMPKYLDLRIR